MANGSTLTRRKQATVNGHHAALHPEDTHAEAVGLFNSHGVLTEPRPGRFRELVARDRVACDYGDYAGIGLTVADIATEVPFDHIDETLDAFDVAVWEGERLAGYLSFRRGEPTVGVSLERSGGAASPALSPTWAPPANDEPRDLMVDVIRWAAHQRREAMEQVRRAEARYSASATSGNPARFAEARSWERWVHHCRSMAIEAERRLTEAVLIAGGRIEDSGGIEGMGTEWRPVAFECDRVIYCVSQDPNVVAPCPILTVVETEDFNADWMLN